MRKRYFTLAQANALLPRVRPRIERLMQLSVHLRSSADGNTSGVTWLGAANDPIAGARSAADPDQGRALAACLYETLSQELKGVEAIGAEVKDLSIGLTVFPSYLDGSTEVLLSWTVAEAQIHTFYAPQGGYRQRKPVEGRTFTAVRTPAGQLRE